MAVPRLVTCSVVADLRKKADGTPQRDWRARRIRKRGSHILHVREANFSAEPGGITGAARCAPFPGRVVKSPVFRLAPESGAGAIAYSEALMYQAGRMPGCRLAPERRVIMLRHRSDEKNAFGDAAYFTDTA